MQIVIREDPRCGQYQESQTCSRVTSKSTDLYRKGMMCFCTNVHVWKSHKENINEYMIQVDVTLELAV